MGINKDQVDGRVKEAAGKVQEVAGRTVGSPTQELKGKVKKNVGAAQAELGDAKERFKSNVKDADNAERTLGRKSGDSHARAARDMPVAERHVRRAAQASVAARARQISLPNTKLPCRAIRRGLVCPQLKQCGIRGDGLMRTRDSLSCRSQSFRDIWRRPHRHSVAVRSPQPPPQAQRQESVLLGLQPLELRARGRLGGEISRRRIGEQDPREHAPAVRAAAQRRLALRQGQCGVDPRALQGVGIRCAHRDVRCAVSDPKVRLSGNAQARPRFAHRSRSRRSPRIRPRARPPSSCPPTTPIPRTAT